MADISPEAFEGLTDDFGAFEPDIRLTEYEPTPYFELSDTALASLRNDVNRDGVERIEATFNAKGEVSLTATQYVGVVALRDGPTIEIKPKAAGTHLLHLLRYAQGVTTTTIDQEVSLEAGNTFIDAIGYIFNSELSTILDRGLHSEYQRVNQAEKQLRGRLDVQRQLQQQQRPALAFECDYDELTTDTVVNRAILYATAILLRLVRDTDLRRSLQRHQHVLRRQVTLTPVEPSALSRVELTRLNDHYGDIIRLTKLVLQSHFIREFRGGSRESFSLLVDMNRIFERVVERAMRNAVSTRPGWSVDAQHSSTNLVESTKHTVTIRPDILIRDDTGQVRCIGDAKWKRGSPSNSDFYQLASYQLAFDSPGLLLYPAQSGDVASENTIAGGHPLHLVEMPTKREGESVEYESYIAEFEECAQRVMNNIF
jgi:5-methylcytosine-specific restriction enzyme subunit McrC